MVVCGSVVWWSVRESGGRDGRLRWPVGVRGGWSGVLGGGVRQGEGDGNREQGSGGAVRFGSGGGLAGFGDGGGSAGTERGVSGLLWRG